MLFGFDIPTISFIKFHSFILIIYCNYVLHVYNAIGNQMGMGGLPNSSPWGVNPTGFGQLPPAPQVDPSLHMQQQQQQQQQQFCV